ncbi:MAG: YceG family protein [Peptostreptococcaceae bacterium]|jgi:hypothetical protein|nr:YceG family protein [Peptostreptococcaceae bacterium]
MAVEFLDSKNIFADIFLAQNKRPKKTQKNAVYLLRYIGFDDKQNLQKLLKDFVYRLKIRNLEYKIIYNLDNKIPMDVVSFLKEKIDDNYSSLDKITDIARDIKNIINIDSIDINLRTVLLLFIKNHKNLSKTIYINFLAHIIYWFKKIDYEHDLKHKNLDHPSKIIFLNHTKYQEYFIYLLCLLENDILYFNDAKDLKLSNFDLHSILMENKNHDINFYNIFKDIENELFDTNSKTLNKGNSKDTQIQNNFKISNHTNSNIETINNNNNNVNISLDRIKRNKIKDNKQNDVKALNLKNTALISENNLFENRIQNSYKNSFDFKKDIFLELKNRSEYVFNKDVLISNYFLRIIKTENDKIDYSNSLHLLKDNLNYSNLAYVVFDNKIELPNNIELNNLKNLFDKYMDFNNLNSIKEILIKYLNTKDELIFNTLYLSFLEIINEYIKNESANINMMKNFLVKFIYWIKAYGFNLYEKTDYKIHNPKAIYFGNIKKHEAYFIYYLSKIGFDMIYINPIKDLDFEFIKKSSYLKEYDREVNITNYPKEEIFKREETHAFKAHEEIKEILFNEETNMFRPWQFEKHKIIPLSLKTTYDELNILLKEDARIRDGFKYNQKNIYIPNIFAKISGVKEDLESYNKDILNIINLKNTVFYDDIPFNNIKYSSGNEYIIGNVFDANMNIIRENLFKHNLYNYNHLSNSIQNNIIDKINEIYEKNILNRDMDLKLRKRILLTILNLDKNILSLIQKYDYPFYIPKLMIYDSKEEMFNIVDSIIIAFLYLYGFDIIIITPTGYNNIEHIINTNYFTTFKLEDFKHDYSFKNLSSPKKKKSFFKNFFGSDFF